MVQTSVGFSCIKSMLSANSFRFIDTSLGSNSFLFVYVVWGFPGLLSAFLGLKQKLDQ